MLICILICNFDLKAFEKHIDSFEVSEDQASEVEKDYLSHEKASRINGIRAFFGYFLIRYIRINNDLFEHCRKNDEGIERLRNMLEKDFKEIHIKTNLANEYASLTDLIVMSGIKDAILNCLAISDRFVPLF